MHFRACVLSLFALLPARAAETPVVMPVERVATNIYVVVAPTGALPDARNKGWVANSAFVVGRDGVLVIDTGASGLIGHGLQAAIASVTDLPVRWIVLTHGHADHVLGTAVLATAKTEIWSSAATRERIERDGAAWVERLQRQTGGASGRSTVVVPTHVVEAWTSVSFGDIRVDLRPVAAAHAPGDLMVWLPKNKILFSGDVVSVERTPVLADARVQPWIAALKEIEDLGAPTVIPGHGPVGSGIAVRRQRAYLEDLWKVVEEGQAGGQTSHDLVPRVRTLMANRHATYFPDFELHLEETVKVVFAQVQASRSK